MSEELKHSKLPWRLHTLYPNDVCVNGGWVILTCHILSNPNESKANAMFLIDACNNYDALRKQLEIATESNINICREWEIMKSECDALRKQLEGERNVRTQVIIQLGEALEKLGIAVGAMGNFREAVKKPHNHGDFVVETDFGKCPRCRAEDELILALAEIEKVGKKK